MKNIYKTIALLVVLFLFSCEKDATIPVPKSEPQLVVSNFLSTNEDTTALRLWWSAPIYYSPQEKLEPIDKANVELKHNNTSYKLKYEEQFYAYLSTVPKFKSGDNIQLLITTSDKTIKSSCTIPQEPLYDIKIGKAEYIEDETSWYYYKYEVSFTSKNTSKNNRYRLVLTEADTFNEHRKERNIISKSGFFFELKNGEEHKIELKLYREVTFDKINAYIINCDENYYLYHKSISLSQEGDIFTEPTIVYSNIEGGLGGFGAYNMVKETIIVK